MISIIIPTYNEGATVDRCLAALQAQTAPEESDREIIVVDDGSTDGNAERLRALGWHVIEQSNQGPAAARNKGARVANGDLLLFLDADCMADPAWVEEMAIPFEDPDVVAVVGAYRTRQRQLAARFVQLEFEERYRLLARGDSVDWIGSYAVGIRRDAFEQVGGFASGLLMNEDVEISYRIARSGGKIVFSPAAIVYHEHPETLLRYFRTKFWRAYWRIFVYRRYPDKAVRDSYTPQTLKLQVALVYPMLLGVAVAPLRAPGWWLASSCALVSTATMVPFLTNAFRQGRVLGLFSFVALWTRALAMAFGVAAATLHNVLGVTKSRD